MDIYTLNTAGRYGLAKLFNTLAGAVRLPAFGVRHQYFKAMTRSEKNMAITAIKKTAGGWKYQFLSAKDSYTDSNGNDSYRLDIWPLDEGGMKNGTLHGIDRICLVAAALDLSIYVTTDTDADTLHVHIF